MNPMAHSPLENDELLVDGDSHPGASALDKGLQLPQELCRYQVVRHVASGKPIAVRARVRRRNESVPKQWPREGLTS